MIKGMDGPNGRISQWKEFPAAPQYVGNAFAPEKIVL